MITKQPAAQYYDKLSFIYDDATSKPGAWTPPKYIAKETRKWYRGGNILIIGVGTGTDIAAISPLGSGLIEGVDISEKMLEICRKKYQTVVLHCADFIEFNHFTLEPYGLIICSGTLEFIENLEAFFVKCVQLLLGNGILIITFEPVILNHRLQSEARSMTAYNPETNVPAKDFYTFRRSFQQIQCIATSSGLKIMEHFEFIAYRKADVDIVYHCVILKKTQSVQK